MDQPRTIVGQAKRSTTPRYDLFHVLQPGSIFGVGSYLWYCLTVSTALSIVTSVVYWHNDYVGVHAADMQLDDYNICLLSDTQMALYLDCILVKSVLSPELKAEADALLGKFPGLNMGEMIMLICKASNDDGEAVVDQFLDQFGDSMRSEMLKFLMTINMLRFYLLKTVIFTTAILDLWLSKIFVLSADVALDDYNICLLSEKQMNSYVDCIYNRPNLSAKAQTELVSLREKFPGLNLGEMIVLICKASNDDGESVVDQFLDSFDDSLRTEVIDILSVCLPLARESAI